MSSITPLVIGFLDAFLVVAKVVLGILAATMGFGIISFLAEHWEFVVPKLAIAVVLAVIVHSGAAWLAKIFKPMMFHHKMKRQRKKYEAKHRVEQEKKWINSIHDWVVEARIGAHKPLF